jgi:diguanylate cyclase (GGDEF)-like protein/PAS domain S-box-containing protein
MSERASNFGIPLRIPQKRILANALSSIANAIFITDRIGRIVWANDAFCQLSGYSRKEILGHTPSLMKSGMQSEAFYVHLWRTILAGKVWRGVIMERRKDGTLYSVDQTITPLIDEHGAISYFIAIQQDMAPRNKESERNQYLAYHDVLTGLPNRAFLVDAEGQALSDAKRTHHAMALLFLDLDRFKPVNDTYGHVIGDRLLLTVAERLSATLRKSDTVARIGGDEFAILLPDLLDTDIAVTLARKLTETLARPFMIADKKISIGASIGIALYPSDGEEFDELMQKADHAMYLAKQRGGNGYQLCST